tara:strand:- start:28393 stop:29691 length:1299 start_codon:yes stop_codon:yes gene_type:complete
LIKLIEKLKNIANTEDKKRLLSNFFSLSFLQTFTYILPLLTLPYLVRVLGSEKFGLVVFAQSFIIFFNILVDYGFNLSATREISVNRENKEKLTEIFSSVMSIKFMLIGISFTILSIIIFSFENFSNNIDLYYLTFLWVIGQALFPIWYFQGLEKMKYITIVNITSKLIFTIAIFIFIQNEADYILVPILNGLGFIIGGVLSLWIVHKDFNQRFQIQSFKILIIYFKDSSQFFLSRLSSVGYSNVNTFLSGILLSPVFVTYYYLADKAASVILTLFNPVVQTIYPYLAKKYNFVFLVKLLSILMTVSLLVVSLGYLCSDLISIILLGEINNIFKNLFYVILPIVPISILYVMLGAPLLLARGFKKEFNLSIIYGFIIHSLIMLMLYYYFTINSDIQSDILILFAISLVFSKFIVLMIRSYYVYINKLYKKTS